MPMPASVWLTSDPTSPAQPVKVVMTNPQPDFRREHTFAVGAPLRGDFPVSSGRYRLTGLDGACAIDLVLRPDRQSDVVVRLDDTGGCSFAVVTEHDNNGGGITHDQPAVLVAP